MENVLSLPQNIPHLLRQGQADAREMSALLEIGQTLADSPHLRPAMSRALELLGRALGVTRGFVMLLDPETEELHVEAAYGLDEDASRRVVYRAGEGVVGHVAETGKPVVVPQASREPQLLRRLAGRERTPVRQELSFVCVPLLVSRRAVGVLGVDLPYAEGRDYERLTRLLALVASMVAQALKVERLAETELARLADENAHLKQELRGAARDAHRV